MSNKQKAAGKKKTADNERRSRQRRDVMPGFPREGKFQTKEEVEAYFAGEQIQCLLCGKWFQQISRFHLANIHNTTLDAYRERYGLPRKRGLSSAAFREKNRQRTLRLMEAGLVPSFADQTFRESVGRAASQQESSPQPPQPQTKWTQQDFEAILTRMQEQHRTLYSVCKDADVPSIKAWKRFIKKHPEFEEKLRQVYDNLPYAVQLRGRYKVSLQFQAECLRLHNQGMSQRKIGQTLGVSEDTVRRMLHKAHDTGPAKEAGDTREDLTKPPADTLLSTRQAVGSKKRAAANEDHRRRSRDVMPGFPREGKFQTKEEVEAYFAGEQIQCLLCGKWFQQISRFHLSSIHNTTLDAYRERYGLPRKRGLSSAVFREKNRQRILQRMQAGVMPSFADKTFRESVGQAVSQREHPSQTSQSQIKWTQKDFEAILTRMQEQHRTLHNVCQDADLPSAKAWKRFVKKHPEFEEKLRQVYDSLPYALQVRAGHDLSPQFHEECLRLHNQGMGQRKIASALGVGERTVVRVLKAAKATAEQTSQPEPRKTRKIRKKDTLTPTQKVKQPPRVTTLRTTSARIMHKKALQEFKLHEVKQQTTTLWVPQEYIDNAFEEQKGVVIDHATGVMWQQSGSPDLLSYEDAQKYIEELQQQKFAGYTDWRLPTIPELMSLLEPQVLSNGLHINPVFDKQPRWCWSGDRRFQAAQSRKSAWLVFFSTGAIGWDYLDGAYYVRAIRSIDDRH